MAIQLPERIYEKAEKAFVEALQHSCDVAAIRTVVDAIKGDIVLYAMGHPDTKQWT